METENKTAEKSSIIAICVDDFDKYGCPHRGYRQSYINL